MFYLTSAHHFASWPRSAKNQSDAKIQENEEEIMDLLWTLAVILLILWILGLVTSYTLGGFVHLLLVVAIIVVLLRVIQSRKPFP